VLGLALLAGFVLIVGIAAAWLTGDRFRPRAFAFWCVIVVAACAAVVTWVLVSYMAACLISRNCL